MMHSVTSAEPPGPRERPAYIVEQWVFGYGSLMWNPGFPHLEARPALLEGAHRALCLKSPVHRGTRSMPGLAFGLDMGGRCQGVVFRLADETAPHIVREIKKREQTLMTYREATRRVILLDGSQRAVRALCFLVVRNHPLYAGDLTLGRMVWMVRSAAGRSGRCADYILSTHDHLQEAGVIEPQLTRIVNAVSPARLPRAPDLARRCPPRRRSYGVLKPVQRPLKPQRVVRKKRLLARHAANGVSQ